MILYDITMTIEDNMAVYKNREDKRPRLVVTRDFAAGSVFETRLEIDLHTGTHIDMPLHVIPGGDASEHWAMGGMFTRCVVLDFVGDDAPAIGSGLLEQKWKEMESVCPVSEREYTVLLKTKNSLQDHFDFNFIYLEKTGAVYLAEKKIGGVSKLNNPLCSGIELPGSTRA